MKNNTLSILIPTFNRCDFLKYSLSFHLPKLKKYGIMVYIFDNASTDDTKSVVEEFKKKYDNISYHCHDENIGGVKNFEYALNFPTTEYVWILGDTYQFDDKTIDVVNECLSSNITPDVIVLNLEGKVNTESKIYSDPNELMIELGGLMTCIAVSIFRRDLVKNNILDRYHNLWFTHMAIIFESMVSDNLSVRWFQSCSITLITAPCLEKTNWSQTSKALDIACKDWSHFVLSLPPSYRLESKLICLMSFGKISGLFSLRSLLVLRMLDILNIRNFFKYKKYFTYTIKLPLHIVFFISILPRNILFFLKKIWVRVRGLR